MVLTSSRDILESGQKLEKLVEDFNETFGLVLATDMLALIVAQTLISFLLGMFPFIMDLGLIGSTGSSLIVNSCATFVICHVAEEFNHAIKKLASSLKPQRSSLKYCRKSRGDPFKISMLHAKWIKPSVKIAACSIFGLGRAT